MPIMRGFMMLIRAIILTPRSIQVLSTYRYNSWYYAYYAKNNQYQSYYYAPGGSAKEDAAWESYYYAYYQNLYAQYNYYGYNYDSYQGYNDRESDIYRNMTLLYD